MGRIDFFVVVSLLVGCLTFPVPGYAQSSFSVGLSGTVYSQSESQHIARAVLRLCDDGGSLIEQTYSSDRGEFAFAGLRPARMTLKVEATGFDPAEFHVDLRLGSQSGRLTHAC